MHEWNMQVAAGQNECSARTMLFEAKQEVPHTRLHQTCINKIEKQVVSYT